MMMNTFERIFYFQQDKFQSLPLTTQSSKLLLVLKAYFNTQMNEKKSDYLQEYQLYLSWIDKKEHPKERNNLEDEYHFWMKKSGHFRGNLPFKKEISQTVTKKKYSSIGWSVLLDHFRSGHNTGAVFRTAEAFQFHSIILLGYTPQPNAPSVAVSAMGAQNWIPSQKENSFSAFMKKKANSIPLFALEITANAKPIGEWNPPKEGILILGNEERGISQKILNHCKSIIQIPIYGRKNSLNVSNSFAIAAHHIHKNIPQL